MPDTALQIFCCRVTDIDAVLLQRYQLLLDAAEQQRCAAFRSTPAQTQFIISRALLRTTLATRLCCAPHELRFTRDADDKPQLAAPFTGWYFNLSHSRDWVVLALSKAGPVGIDVESHERGNDLTAIARRFFSDAENDSLLGLEGELWLQQFFAIWTLKEAHGKALGTGLSKILSCSGFIVDRATAHVELQLAAIAASASTVNCWLYRLAADTSLAVSQLNTPPTAATLYRCVPLAELGASETYLKPETYLKLVPIASGSWAAPVEAGV